MDPWKRERVTSYAEDDGEALVAAPHTEAELAQVLARARALGKRVSFQAGRQSLDKHPLPARADDVVVSMRHFGGIAVDTSPTDDPHSAWVTAGAGARWGDVLRACEAERLVPYVVVTSSNATLGGTVASDCLSRFTTDHGKESRLVSNLRMMWASGEVEDLTCPQHERVHETHPALGVIGGFGLLGAVLSVRFRVHRVADAGDAPLAVRSVVRKYHDLPSLLAALLSRAYPLVQDRSYRNPKALYAVAAYTDDPARWRNLLLSSYYVRSAPGRGHRMPQHIIDGPARVLGEWGKRVPGLTSAFWQLVHWGLRPRYVDPLHDYTFFMDGNAYTKEVEHALGIRTRVRQQTFLIPTPIDHARRTYDGRLAQEFLARTREVLAAHGARPTLLDVLFVPEDEAYLSGSYRMPGLAITAAFEPLRARALAASEAALVELSAVAERLGGRVHLTKRVCADPAVIGRMYAHGLAKLAELKDRLDPQRLFDSAFAEQVLRPAAASQGLSL